jgi:hypothetical protein
LSYGAGPVEVDQNIKEIFAQVEKYVLPLLARQSDPFLSKEENRILALQQINRLNQRIGQIARSSKDEYGEMRILQTYINGITAGVKTDNVPQIKASIARAKSYIESE